MNRMRGWSQHTNDEFVDNIIMNDNTINILIFIFQYSIISNLSLSRYFFSFRTRLSINRRVTLYRNRKLFRCPMTVR